MEKPHKYDLGIIGNCAYLALIDTTANVRWMCWPRFDSSFIFGGLMDEEEGGEFYVRPGTDNYTSSQQYLTNTNVLETTFEAETGSFKVTDFAPRFFNHGRAYKPLALIRKVEGELGADGRVLVRYSGTENKARVMVEGPTEELTESLAGRIAEIVRNTLS